MSTLAQVMTCCLLALSNYLNQCWHLIIEALWHSPEQFDSECPSFCIMCFEMMRLELLPHLPGAIVFVLGSLVSHVLVICGLLSALCQPMLTHIFKQTPFQRQDFQGDFQMCFSNGKFIYSDCNFTVNFSWWKWWLSFGLCNGFEQTGMPFTWTNTAQFTWHLLCYCSLIVALWCHIAT